MGSNRQSLGRFCRRGLLRLPLQTPRQCGQGELEPPELLGSASAWYLTSECSGKSPRVKMWSYEPEQLRAFLILVGVRVTLLQTAVMGRSRLRCWLRPRDLQLPPQQHEQLHFQMQSWYGFLEQRTSF